MSQQPDFSDAYKPPLAKEVLQPPQPPKPEEGDVTHGIIPYKNPCALLAYYLGLFSLFPILGLFLAMPAFVLGMMGLRARSRNPAIKGSVHAWIGIIMGFMFTLIWGCATFFLVVGLVYEAQRR